MKPHESDHESDHQSPLTPPHGGDKPSADDRFAPGDPLWELLGQARESEVSPFFARNVARAARQELAAKTAAKEESPLAALIAALRIVFRWRSVAIAAPAIAIALIAAASFTHESEWSHDTVTAFAPSGTTDADNPVIDFDIINNLDELLAMEESSEETALWLNVP